MLHTSICDLLEIEHPIIQAGMGPFTSAELVAAVSNAGGLGSVGGGARSTESLQENLARTKALTSRSFAVNFTLSPVPPTEEQIALALQARPRVISFALGDPEPYVKRVHGAGIRVMHQVSTVEQARRAAELGVDIIIAQGSEAGGYGGWISAMVLIPQVVDAVRPIPVVAAGGIADGRELAAALVLGAQGANIGTRFLASIEAPVSESWKRAILSAGSQDAIKVEFWGDIFPPRGSAYPTVPRALTSPFIEEWQGRREAVQQQAERLRGEVAAAVAQGKLGELFPYTGQTAGLVKDILPAGEIVHRLVAEAEEALKQGVRLAS